MRCSRSWRKAWRRNSCSDAETLKRRGTVISNVARNLLFKTSVPADFKKYLLMIARLIYCRTKLTNSLQPVSIARCRGDWHRGSICRRIFARYEIYRHMDLQQREVIPFLFHWCINLLGRQKTSSFPRRRKSSVFLRKVTGSPTSRGRRMFDISTTRFLN